jgi:predicted dehydrogenase
MSNKPNITDPSRRDFLKDTGRIAVATTLVTGASRMVHAAENNAIQVALVGCGGRGTGAAVNALSAQAAPTKLVALADVFENRLKASAASLGGKFGPQGTVAEDKQFLGFDAYRQAMDCLRPGDVVILATPPAFRWVQFAYAIEKGLNVFMEKPITVDGPTTKRMFDLGKKAEAKNLKVGVGLMCRHCKARQELSQRIADGQLGDVLLLRAYRMAGPTGTAACGPKPSGANELLYQIQNFHAFLWLSGGAVSDFLIHNIDEGCWAKGAWPVNARASGGRHYRGSNVDQNFDTYSIEYTFADGTKLQVEGRTMPGCQNEFATFVHGTKGAAVFSTAGHVPARSRIYRGQNFHKDDLVWAYPQPEPNPYQVEWEDLLTAIKDNQPYNEVERGAMASVVTSMGRMAAHTGRLITLDEILACEHEFAPNLDKLTLDGPSPLTADANGKYPIPLPGLVTDREY